MTAVVAKTTRRVRPGAFSLPVADGADKARTYGQFFTPLYMVEAMAAIRTGASTVLEPACGSGVFSDYLRTIAGLDVTAIELDPAHAPSYAKCMDFFDYPVHHKFRTVIGNPPYVAWRDVADATRDKAQALGTDLFGQNANLYLWFIYKAVLHLEPGGELIFIVPREFPQATSAARLNSWLYANGSITHFWETGDERVFSDASPPCCVFRYEKGRVWDRRMADGRMFGCNNGILTFSDSAQGTKPLSDFFTVAVGGVSGADHIYAHPSATTEVVGSATQATGHARRMLMGKEAMDLLHHRKDELLARRIRNFTDSNWWEWGRGFPESTDPRIYVVTKTRRANPFFLHRATAFDGSIMALFPVDRHMDLRQAAKVLNRIDWASLGFVAGGRTIFGQRTLANVLLPTPIADALAACCNGYIKRIPRTRSI